MNIRYFASGESNGFQHSAKDMRVIYISIVTFLWALLCLVSLPSADMYKYQDESGAISITNNLESVPRKYRKVMTVVKEETPSQGKLLPPVVVKKEEPEQVVHSSQEMPDVTPVAQKNNRERYVKTGLAIVGGLVLLVIIRRLTATLGFQKIGTVFCLLMILVGGVYLYGLYIEEMRSVFGNLRRDALNIKKNVDTRELKTEGTLKKIEE